MYNYRKPMLLLPVMVLSGIPLTANSASWKIEPSIEVKETYTDNVDLDANSQQSDFVTQVTPGLLVVGSGSRLDMSLKYAPMYLYYPGDDKDKHDLRQNLQTNIHSELVDETFFVDGSANIAQQFVDRRQAISSSEASRTNNRRTIQSYRFSPYLVKRIGSIATAQLKYEFGHIRQDNDALNLFPTLTLGNSVSHKGSFLVSSGTDFSRLGWNLLAQYSTEDRRGDQDYKDTTLRADGSYQLTNIFSLLGSMGYQNRDAVGSFANFDGFIWDAGFRLVPGPRTSLSFRYGNQYNGDTYSLNAQYKITAKNAINLSYTDLIQTYQSFAFNNNDIIDPAFNSDFSSSDLTRRKSWILSLSGTRGRTTYSASAFYNKYRSDNNNLDEKRYGGSISLSRNLNQRLSVSSSFSYNLSEFLSDNIKDRFWSVAASANYKISKSLIGTLGYIHSDRDQARFGNLNGGSNYVSLSIRAEL